MNQIATLDILKRERILEIEKCLKRKEKGAREKVERERKKERKQTGCFATTSRISFGGSESNPINVKATESSPSYYSYFLKREKGGREKREEKKEERKRERRKRKERRERKKEKTL